HLPVRASEHFTSEVMLWIAIERLHANLNDGLERPDLKEKNRGRNSRCLERLPRDRQSGLEDRERLAPPARSGEATSPHQDKVALRAIRAFPLVAATLVAQPARRASALASERGSVRVLRRS